MNFSITITLKQLFIAVLVSSLILGSVAYFINTILVEQAELLASNDQLSKEIVSINKKMGLLFKSQSILETTVNTNNSYLLKLFVFQNMVSLLSLGVSVTTFCFVYNYSLSTPTFAQMAITPTLTSVKLEQIDQTLHVLLLRSGEMYTALSKTGLVPFCDSTLIERISNSPEIINGLTKASEALSTVTQSL